MGVAPSPFLYTLLYIWQQRNPPETFAYVYIFY